MTATQCVVMILIFDPIVEWISYQELSVCVEFDDSLNNRFQFIVTSS